MNFYPTEKPLIIFEEITNFWQLPEYFIQHYHTHLLCLKGCMEFKFNSQKMLCEAGNFNFWFAESNVSEVKFSKNFKAKIVLVEHQFLLNNIPDQSWGIGATIYSRENPVISSLSEKEHGVILSNFSDIYDRFLDNSHRFYDEILRLQMQVFVLDMWNLFAQYYENRKYHHQSGTLYERFIELVQEHCLREREVQFYADKLSITPKYLNLISKNSSGTTASEWIKRYARERILLLLENKKLNIAEIADEMEFSSRSFFTRYVKKLLGVTPSEYRLRMAGL